jgi:hypothetical protein
MATFTKVGREADVAKVGGGWFSDKTREQSDAAR